MPYWFGLPPGEDEPQSVLKPRKQPAIKPAEKTAAARMEQRGIRGIQFDPLGYLADMEDLFSPYRYGSGFFPAPDPFDDTSKPFRPTGSKTYYQAVEEEQEATGLLLSTDMFYMELADFAVTDYNSKLKETNKRREKDGLPPLYPKIITRTPAVQKFLDWKDQGRKPDGFIKVPLTRTAEEAKNADGYLLEASAYAREKDPSIPRGRPLTEAELWIGLEELDPDEQLLALKAYVSQVWGLPRPASTITSAGWHFGSSALYGFGWPLAEHIENAARRAGIVTLGDFKVPTDNAVAKVMGSLGMIAGFTAQAVMSGNVQGFVGAMPAGKLAPFQLPMTGLDIGAKRAIVGLSSKYGAESFAVKAGGFVMGRAARFGAGLGIHEGLLGVTEGQSPGEIAQRAGMGFVGGMFFDGVVGGIMSRLAKGVWSNEAGDLFRAKKLPEIMAAAKNVEVKAANLEAVGEMQLPISVTRTAGTGKTQLQLVSEAELSNLNVVQAMQEFTSSHNRFMSGLVETGLVRGLEGRVSGVNVGVNLPGKRPGVHPGQYANNLVYRVRDLAQRVRSGRVPTPTSTKVDAQLTDEVNTLAASIRKSFTQQSDFAALEAEILQPGAMAAAKRAKLERETDKLIREHILKNEKMTLPEFVRLNNAAVVAGKRLSQTKEGVAAMTEMKQQMENYATERGLTHIELREMVRNGELPLLAMAEHAALKMGLPLKRAGDLAQVSNNLSIVEEVAELMVETLGRLEGKAMIPHGSPAHLRLLNRAETQYLNKRGNLITAGNDVAKRSQKLTDNLNYDLELAHRRTKSTTSFTETGRKEYQQLRPDEAGDLSVRKMVAIQGKAPLGDIAGIEMATRKAKIPQRAEVINAQAGVVGDKIRIPVSARHLVNDALIKKYGLEPLLYQREETAGGFDLYTTALNRKLQAESIDINAELGRLSGATKGNAVSNSIIYEWPSLSPGGRYVADGRADIAYTQLVDQLHDPLARGMAVAFLPRFWGLVGAQRDVPLASMGFLGKYFAESKPRLGKFGTGLVDETAADWSWQRIALASGRHQYEILNEAFGTEMPYLLVKELMTAADATFSYATSRFGNVIIAYEPALGKAGAKEFFAKVLDLQRHDLPVPRKMAIKGRGGKDVQMDTAAIQHQLRSVWDFMVQFSENTHYKSNYAPALSGQPTYVTLDSVARWEKATTLELGWAHRKEGTPDILQDINDSLYKYLNRTIKKFYHDRSREVFAHFFGNPQQNTSTTNMARLLDGILKNELWELPTHTWQEGAAALDALTSLRYGGALVASVPTHIKNALQPILMSGETGGLQSLQYIGLRWSPTMQENFKVWKPLMVSNVFQDILRGGETGARLGMQENPLAKTIRWLGGSYNRLEAFNRANAYTMALGSRLEQGWPMAEAVGRAVMDVHHGQFMYGRLGSPLLQRRSALARAAFMFSFETRYVNRVNEALQTQDYAKLFTLGLSATLIDHFLAPILYRDATYGAQMIGLLNGEGTMETIDDVVMGGAPPTGGLKDIVRGAISPRFRVELTPIDLAGRPIAQLMRDALDLTTGFNKEEERFRAVGNRLRAGGFSWPWETPQEYADILSLKIAQVIPGSAQGRRVFASLARQKRKDLAGNTLVWSGGVEGDRTLVATLSPADEWTMALMGNTPAVNRFWHSQGNIYEAANISGAAMDKLQLLYVAAMADKLSGHGAEKVVEYQKAAREAQTGGLGGTTMSTLIQMENSTGVRLAILERALPEMRKSGGYTAAEITQYENLRDMLKLQLIEEQGERGHPARIRGWVERYRHGIGL